LTAQQAEVIAFLTNPASYAGVHGVERFETHGNLVFLAGSEAWKIKRAVRFPYMDFSTLEKRRKACLREVEVNRRFSPDLYLGCVPIMCSAAGALTLAGEGHVVEWAVHMRRFDQSALLSSLASTGPLSDDLAKQLADVVHEGHAQADRAVPPSGARSVRRLVTTVSGALRKAGALQAEDVRRLASSMEDEIRRVAATLDERARCGFVRRCHGDLHLGNIVLWQSHPALYDAIEFDEAIATIDTLYDLAFLLMDLDRHGQRRAANVVLNRYLWRSKDNLNLAGLVALPLFMALRAAVRAMVTIDRAAQEDCVACACDLERARGYLLAALQHVAPAAPRLIVVGGQSGTGKTTLATALAPLVGGAPGAVHLRSDLERKAAASVGELDRLPAGAYTPQARRHVYRLLRDKAQVALSARASVIVDAVYAQERQRRDIEAAAAKAGISFRGLWLTADREKLMARVAARRNDASDATPDTVATQLQPEVGAMSPAWSVIDAGSAPSDTLRLASSYLGLEVETA
jgi:aminoglycoside phosphotransferase family enzyme/predicted kinase